MQKSRDIVDLYEVLEQVGGQFSGIRMTKSIRSSSDLQDSTQHGSI